MASNLTPFYGLSQWLGTDNFSREDFNSDNSKIDTALANIKYAQAAQPWKIVAYTQPEAELTTLSLSLEGIDLSEYLYLVLVAEFKCSESSESSCYLRLNNVSTGTYYRTGKTDAQNYFMRMDIKKGYPQNRVLRFAPYEEGKYVCASYESFSGADAGSNNAIATGVKWDALKSIDCSAASVSVPMKAGSSLYLYGIKKP